MACKKFHHLLWAGSANSEEVNVHFLHLTEDSCSVLRRNYSCKSSFKDLCRFFLFFFNKHISKGTICDCKGGLHTSLKGKVQNIPTLVYQNPTKGPNTQMHNRWILFFFNRCIYYCFWMMIGTILNKTLDLFDQSQCYLTWCFCETTLDHLWAWSAFDKEWASLR